MRLKMILVILTFLMLDFSSPQMQSVNGSELLTPQPTATQANWTPFRHQDGVTQASVDEPPLPTTASAGQFRHDVSTFSDTACVSFTQAPCDEKNRAYSEASSTYGSSFAAACKTSIDNFCVESLAVNTQGASHNLKPLLNIPIMSNVFTGDPAHGVPGSGTLATIWKDESSSELYASSLMLQFSFDSAGKLVARNNTTTPFTFSVKRVALKDKVISLDKQFAVAPCVYSVEDSCFVDVLHDYSQSISASVRLPFKLTGWFYGRMIGTTVKAAQSSAYQRYQFTGAPVAIPVFAKEIPKTECVANWCPDRLMVEALLGVNWEKSFGTGFMADKTKGSWQYLTPAQGLTPWQAFVQMSDDTASDVRSAWQISFSNTLASISNLGSCPDASQGVNGVLSSNSMIYSSFGPSLQSGSFFYRVAGLHYMPDGKTPVAGTYELQIDSKLARCVFKLSKAPITATLSVIAENGTQSQVVGSSSERDGMFRIAMQGFHFSTPQLKAKIIQGKPQSTIACASIKQSSIVKFVKATNPKCPAGYSIRK